MSATLLLGPTTVFLVLAATLCRAHASRSGEVESACFTQLAGKWMGSMAKGGTDELTVALLMQSAESAEYSATSATGAQFSVRAFANGTGAVGDWAMLLQPQRPGAPNCTSIKFPALGDAWCAASYCGALSANELHSRSMAAAGAGDFDQALAGYQALHRLGDFPKAHLFEADCHRCGVRVRGAGAGWCGVRGGSRDSTRLTEHLAAR